MGINFPSAPTVGDLYPVPVVPGIPQYKWDGTSWLVVIQDTQAYVRRAGDSMTGLLTLSGDPTAALHAVTKQYAAPFDAMSYSGMQINGSMDISQELGTTGTGADFTYAIDGWKLSKNGTMVPIAVQSASSGLFPGFSNMLSVVFSTAQASLGTGDVLSMLHPIEGYRIARLAWGTANARPITIAFWSDHFKPGLYSVVARNNPANRSYAATYTQAASNVPQYNVITIPGDTSGTWATNNALGLMLVFCVGAGSTYVAPSANTWSAGAFHAAPGQVNGADSTSNAFRITGVVVLPGTQAPTAAQSPMIMRPFDQELVTCQRYYEKGSFGVYSPAVSSVGVGIGTNTAFTVAKRATPSITNNFIAFSAVTTPFFYNHVTVTGYTWSIATNSTAAAYIYGDYIADARL